MFSGTLQILKCSSVAKTYYNMNSVIMFISIFVYVCVVCLHANHGYSIYSRDANTFLFITDM